jgi:hypothetical protein
VATTIPRASRPRPESRCTSTHCAPPTCIERAWHGDREAAGGALDEAASAAREHAIDQAAKLAEHIAPALGALGPITNAVVGLGEAYHQGIEKPRHEGDAGVRAELQLRADRGFVDAAGYAKTAAREMEAIQRQVADKLEQAGSCADPARANELRAEASALTKKEAAVQDEYLAPVLSKAHGDAAYGLGVEYAMYLASCGDSPSAVARFDAAFGKANANVVSATPPTFIRG